MLNKYFSEEWMHEQMSKKIDEHVLLTQSNFLERLCTYSSDIIIVCLTFIE